MYLKLSIIGYKKEIDLNDNESAAKINLDTGEVTEFISKSSNVPEGKVIFEPKAIFRKDYTKAWEFLDKELTPLEFKVVSKLCRMAKMNTNSLEPLNDETTIPVLVDEFNISKNKVKPIFNKLFKLGVYGKFDIYRKEFPYTKHWILNPYLSFSGKIINSDIAKLFIGTEIEKAFNNKV